LAHWLAKATSSANPGDIGAEPARPTICSSACITSTVTDRLCGSIPITTRECSLMLTSRLLDPLWWMEP
jgi:hypothetical protein